MTHKTFFLVWNPSTGYTQHKHETFESAEIEAERLARQNPTAEFHVLQSIAKCKKQDVVWERAPVVYLDLASEESDSSVNYFGAIQ